MSDGGVWSESLRVRSRTLAAVHKSEAEGQEGAVELDLEEPCSRLKIQEPVRGVRRGSCEGQGARRPPLRLHASIMHILRSRYYVCLVGKVAWTLAAR